MAIKRPDGVTVINIMADGTECDDLSTYLKSAEQLPVVTRQLLAKFMRRGWELAAEEAKKAAQGT